MLRNECTENTKKTQKITYQPFYFSPLWAAVSRIKRIVGWSSHSALEGGVREVAICGDDYGLHIPVHMSFY